MENVSFRNSEVYDASFSIIPKYGQIDLYMMGLNIGPAGEPIPNITISMDVGPNDRIIKPINSKFIGTDIARTADIPTKTSQLTNDSNFVTSDSLATVATSGSYNDLIDKPTIPNVSDYVSYGEAQELTTEQKNQAKSNLDLSYISYESTNILNNKDAAAGSSAQNVYVYDSTAASLLTTLSAGSKFVITVANSNTNPTFTESIECEIISSSSAKVLTDVTNYIFFDKDNIYLSSSYFRFYKKDTAGNTNIHDTMYYSVVYDNMSGNMRQAKIQSNSCFLLNGVILQKILPKFNILRF